MMDNKDSFALIVFIFPLYISSCNYVWMVLTDG